MNIAMLKKVVDFLSSIGIPVFKSTSTLKHGFENGVLDGVLIVNGEIHYNSKATISNILHEAGHLAVLPEQYRKLANHDIQKIQLQMLDESSGIDPESDLWRAIIQTGDPEASAWAYAAGKHLGLPEKVIIEDTDYGDDNGKHIRLALSMNSYFGINGLRNSGMVESVKKYPEMIRWVQPNTMAAQQ